MLGLQLGADDYVTKPFSPRSCARASRPCCAARGGRRSRRLPLRRRAKWTSRAASCAAAGRSCRSRRSSSSCSRRSSAAAAASSAGSSCSIRSGTDVTLRRPRRRHSRRQPAEEDRARSGRRRGTWPACAAWDIGSMADSSRPLDETLTRAGYRVDAGLLLCAWRH